MTLLRGCRSRWTWVRLWGVAVLWTVGLLLSTAAQAQCEVYSNDGLLGDLDAVEQSFDEVDLPAAKGRLKTMSRRIPCIEAIVDPRSLARFGRAMSLASFFSQDEDAVIRWGRFAEVADPSLAWGEAYGRGHPWRDMVEAAGDMVVGGPEDKALAIPRNGAVFMDGALLLVPRAEAEVPHLMQVFDAQGAFLNGWWQDGAGFPEQIVGEGQGAVKPPRWYKGGLPPDATAPSGSPVIPLAIAGGLLAGSGGLYVAATASAGSLKNATSMSELTSKRTTTNTLVLASTLAAGAAVGVGVTGVLISGQGVGLRVRF